MWLRSAEAQERDQAEPAPEAAAGLDCGFGAQGGLAGYTFGGRG